MRSYFALGKCSEDDDELIWKINKSGKLLMKSFCSSLESNKGSISFPSKLVWGPWVPLEVGFFAWEVV